MDSINSSIVCMMPPLSQDMIERIYFGDDHRTVDQDVAYIDDDHVHSKHWSIHLLMIMILMTMLINMQVLFMLVLFIMTMIMMLFISMMTLPIVNIDLFIC